MAISFPSRYRWLAAAAVLSALLLTAGCSGSGSDSTPSMGAPAAERDGNDLGAAPPPAEGEGGVEAPTAPDGAPVMAPIDERSLVYTGVVTVRVQSVVLAANEAAAIAVGAGGIVAGDNRAVDDTNSQATLVLRVPADRFSSTVDNLAKLGTELSRQLNVQDVTEALVDLDARIAAQQASVDRVRALLARAQSIAEIVSVESELTQRQAELDSLTQRRARLGGLVSLATITVVFYGPTATVPEEKEEETGFVAGLRSGWDGFLKSVKVVITVIGWLLPWLIAFGVPTLAAVLTTRARRRRRARAVATATPES